MEKALKHSKQRDAILNLLKNVYCHPTADWLHTQLKKDFPIGIVSNKPDAPTKLLCADFFPGIYARGESNDCVRKPAPDMLVKTMALLGVETCIYVGDSDVDVITAKNTGVPCLSVLWGFRDEAAIRQAGGECFCHDPKELVAKLKVMVKEIYGQ